MTANIQKLFNRLAILEPPENLFNKIITQIELEKNLAKIKKQLAIFSLISSLSLAGVILMFSLTQKGFVDSGFTQFLSLLFTDFEIVSAYWQNFAISLIDTLPIMRIILFAASLLVFVYSLKIISKDISFIKTKKLAVKF
jgi:hypothetical protein